MAVTRLALRLLALYNSFPWVTAELTVVAGPYPAVIDCYGLSNKINAASSNSSHTETCSEQPLRTIEEIRYTAGLAAAVMKTKRFGCALQPCCLVIKSYSTKK